MFCFLHLKCVQEINLKLTLYDFIINIQVFNDFENSVFGIEDIIWVKVNKSFLYLVKIYLV